MATREDDMSEKRDTGKLRYDLIPPECLRDIAAVLTMGSEKYTDNGWMKVVLTEPHRYRAALMRHFEAYRAGESHDPESMLPHMAHVAVNAMILLWENLQLR